MNGALGRNTFEMFWKLRE